MSGCYPPCDSAARSGVNLQPVTLAIFLATPPRCRVTIVYGSGYIPLGRMIRYGLLLDLAGVVVIVTIVHVLVPLLR